MLGIAQTSFLRPFGNKRPKVERVLHSLIREVMTSNENPFYMLNPPTAVPYVFRMKSFGHEKRSCDFS